MSQINNSELHAQNSELPDGWRWVRLGEVCEINPSRPKNFTRSSETPTSFIPMAAVDEKTGTIAKPEVVPYSKVSKGYTYFEENDVLFAKITPCMQNGKHVIARNLIDGIGFGTTEFHVLRSKKEVLSEWIYFFIRQPYFLREATAYFTGAVGQQRVPESFLSNYIIPLPPMEEQKHIALRIQELMQEVERARTACERQLEAAKALPAAYLREVFEGEESKKWERKKLAEVCEMVMGQSPPSDSYKKEKIGLPFFQGKADFSIYFPIPQIWCSSPMRIAEPNDILISVRAPVGPVNMADQKCCIGRGLTALRGKGQIDAWFLFFYFKCIENSWKGRGSTFDAIRKDDLENIQITMPPIFEQKRLASELKEKMAEVENLQFAIRNQQSAIDALPQAILRKAFRGELL